MRTITRVAVALGFISAMAVEAPIVAKAQQTIVPDHSTKAQIVQRPNRRQARYNQYYVHRPYAYQYYRGDGRYTTQQYSTPYNPAQSLGPSHSYFGN
jgi:hypothetical protein